MRNWTSRSGVEYLTFLLLSLTILSPGACVSKPTPSPLAPSPSAVTTLSVSPNNPVAEVASAPAPPEVPATDPQILWKSSKHANTFVADTEGKNNECARCHAPLNWMPTAIEDIPSTCQTCKFNMPAPKPVAQTDWKNIGCEQCHRTEKGTVTKQVAWLNAAIAQFDTNADPYEPVKSNAELCEKCHRGAFQINVGKTVHATLSCTDCHNPHSASASCTDSKCHSAVLKPAQPIPGHDAEHAKVACAACHDASKLEVGPTGDQSQWSTFQTLDIGGKKNRAPYVSHNLQRTVDCVRCHSSGNPWGLNPH